MLLIAVAAAVAFGLWRAVVDGRFRPAREARGAAGRGGDDPEGDSVPESVLAGTEYAALLGGRATLLQFSSAFCAPCRAARRTLAEVSELVRDVAHVEVDAESQLDLVRRVGILRTPTTLVLDRHGREVTRAAGAPTRQQVLTALALVEAETGRLPEDR